MSNIFSYYTISLQITFVLLMNKVLVIEDDRALNKTLVELLEAQGFEVLSQEDIDGTFESLKQHQIDLLVLDVMVKEKDGLDLLMAIRANARFSALPVIVITASPMLELKTKGLQRGATDFIFKPFSIQDLTYKIQNLLALKAGILSTSITETIVENQQLVRIEDLFFQKVNAYLLDHIAETINIDLLAAACHVSRSSLDKKIRKSTGNNTSYYIRSFKINIAKSLIAQEFSSMKQIALACGFKNVSYFSTAFGSVMGMTPSQYKNSLK